MCHFAKYNNNKQILQSASLISCWLTCTNTTSNIIFTLFVIQGLFSTFLTFFLLYSTGVHIHDHTEELKRAQQSLNIHSELAKLIQSASATEAILKYRVYYGISAVMTNATDIMPWISILAHLGNVFSKKASFIQHARFDHAYVGYYNDTFEVAENNITKFFQVIPRQLNFPSLSVRDLRLVKEAPYQDIDRPWVKEFFHKNASKPYWTNTFMSLYGQRAVNFVLPIFVNDKSFRRSPPSFPVRVKDSNLSNATFRYNTPFLRIDNLFAMVGIQFTLEYLSDYLKNLTRDSDVLRSFILNSNREILGSASKGGALENDTFDQELSTFIFNKNLGPSNTSSLYRTNTTFEYKNFMVTVRPLNDNYGLNWAVVVIFAKGKNYIDEIFTHGISAVVLFIVLFILQVLVAFCILQYISQTLYNMAISIQQMLRFQSLKKPCRSGAYSIFLDFREMNHSLNKLKMGLQEFSKYVPNIIEKKVTTSNITELVRVEQEIDTSYPEFHPMKSTYARKKSLAIPPTPYLSTLQPYSMLGMKSREMTVMFCGISNFASLSETTNNSMLMNMVTDVMCMACHLIELHFGVIDKIIDGTIMAFWNDDTFPCENHATHACRAALEITEELKRLEDKSWKAKYGTKSNIYSKFQVNIGINTGNMLCGCMGSPLRFCYTVIGDNVNIASRLQYLAQSYGCHIFIGENVQKVVQKAFICFFVDFIKLKGKRLSTSVYCLASFENEANEIQRKLAIDLEMAKEYLYKGEYYHLRQVCEKLVLLLMLPDDLKPEQIEFDSKSELHRTLHDEEYYGFHTIPLRLLHRSLQLITKAGCDTKYRSSSYWNTSQCSDSLSYPNG